MNKNTAFTFQKYILILIFILIICVVIRKFSKNIKQESFGNHKSSCSKVPKAIKMVFEERKKNKTGCSENDFYLPCAYTHCEKDIVRFVGEKKKKKIFIIEGCDTLASKVALWNAIKKKYGEKASEIMPETFVLNNKLDLMIFKEYFYRRKKENKNSKFILKNFKQRQEGLRLINCLKDVDQGIKDDFKLVQDYLENPFLISGRKVNLRYYLLVICDENKIKAYIYKDGFVYYTPKLFKKYSMVFDENITTGYIDRSVYESNPLTLSDFKNYIGSKNTKKWNEEVDSKMYKVLNALSTEICHSKNLSHHTKFQIFGADIAPDESLKATLMEFNKGPDISFKDKADEHVKKNMIRDVFDIIDPIKRKDENGFKRIY